MKKPDTMLRDLGLLAIVVVLIGGAKLWYAQEQGEHYAERLVEWVGKL